MGIGSCAIRQHGGWWGLCLSRFEVIFFWFRGLDLEWHEYMDFMLKDNCTA